jgi:hypothetical protein
MIAAPMNATRGDSDSDFTEDGSGEGPTEGLFVGVIGVRRRPA